ncbi:MAG TPA: MliC family protein [Paracoccus solventivorans]|uniref:MliC family protein n=1 Tax=Paracoccus solventivorans TaxID=53463 RepID=UPI002C5C36E1|nr:MliC family protein [Paracoccus solventivorans]HMM08810.1 MliC family protein [Paracoccus solventivorans]
MRLVTVLSATLLLAAPALAQSPAPEPAPADAAPVQSAAPAAKPAVPPVTEPAPKPETMGQDSLDDVSYACDGDTSMQVVFVNTAAGASYAIVLEQGRMIPMQIAVSASGARYLSIAPEGRYQLWTKGDSADLVALDGDAETPLRSGCTAAS